MRPRPRWRRCSKSGINHFIDLTGLNVRGEPDNLTAYSDIAQEQARRLGLSVDWEQHTIVDGSIPASPWHMARILDAIDAALDEGKTIYLHCLGGVGAPAQWSAAGLCGTDTPGMQPSTVLLSCGAKPDWPRNTTTARLRHANSESMCAAGQRRRINRASDSGHA